MELTPQQWENVKALFEIALERNPSERNSFVAGAAQDPAVRGEVERLLAHHVESGGFLSRTAVAVGFAPVPKPENQSLSAGDFVADRFRIIRFLARGGMGEVYEAQDLELQDRVALKFIRSELLDDPKALDRFKREVQLARKVTHPNVCRIFDLFRHNPKSATGSSSLPLAFVAMELLEGETLADLLRRQPRLTEEQARAIALQMALGLGAAHAAGVLHRDFKPGNVLLVPGAKGLRAVITDFGLALHSNRDLTLGPSVTGTGEIIGTPAYMSPEQVEGKELSPASDVYSLGLVFYQMLTGTRAFEDTTPLSMAVRRIKEDPKPPRAVVSDVDRHWESIILKCLERNPKRRFQNGDTVAEALREERGWLPKLEPRRRLGVLAAIAVLIGAGVVGLSRIHQPIPINVETTASMQPTIPMRPSIAVLPFQNLSGKVDTEWVSTALPEMLTTELAVGGKLRTFPGENITRASTDLGLTGKQTLASDTLRRLRDYLGSDYVVLGSYLDQGTGSDSQVRIDLWLQNTKTGEIAATISEKGGERDLDDVATRAGADLRRKLGIGEVTSDEAAVVRASLPSNTEATRLYSEGLAKLRVVDAVAARDL
ncbi:MAG: protein kinase, partial [Acidobacteriaceae bacterium]|nr:protein kinase [Acidobacteriaceae bacterium]